MRPVGPVIFQGRGTCDAWITRGGFVFRVGVLLAVAIPPDARCAVLVLRFPSPVAAQKNVDWKNKQTDAERNTRNTHMTYIHVFAIKPDT